MELISTLQAERKSWLRIFLKHYVSDAENKTID